MPNKPQLTIAAFKREAKRFAKTFGKDHPELFGATDGKAVGTYVEAKFNIHLRESYRHRPGNAASGVDFPDLAVDVKTTLFHNPQSSSPFKSAEQKVYGLGYNLLVFAYEKRDDPARKVAVIEFKNVVFVHAERTADFQTTKGILGILDREGNAEEVAAFLEERNLPLDEIGRARLAERIMHERPREGYLTMVNALQWRLQYTRVIGLAVKGGTEGAENLLA